MSKYVDFEIAKKLMEMGFDGECKAYYRYLLGTTTPIFYVFDNGATISRKNIEGGIHTYFLAPTFDEAFKFLETKQPPAFVHPELQEGEVLLLNIYPDKEKWSVPNFCESIRIGDVAYTTGGKEIVKEMKPLFGKLKN